jgi:hypothetical protein
MKIQVCKEDSTILSLLKYICLVGDASTFAKDFIDIVMEKSKIIYNAPTASDAELWELFNAAFFIFSVSIFSYFFANVIMYALRKAVTIVSIPIYVMLFLSGCVISSTIFSSILNEKYAIPMMEELINMTENLDIMRKF